MHDFDPTQVVIQYVCLLFSLCFHEAAHAYMADRCGDPSARLMGRISLNPLVHIDPMGTVIMPLLMFTTRLPFVGWAKPVPFNPRNLKDLRRDPVLIAIAGPVSNLILGLVGMLLLRLLMFTRHQYGVESSIVLELAVSFTMINFGLMLFNFLPIPPLDGHYLLNYILPPAGQRVLEKIGPFGIIIVMVLVWNFGVIDVPFRFLASIVQSFMNWDWN